MVVRFSSAPGGMRLLASRMYVYGPGNVRFMMRNALLGIPRV
jgi:hypothetical protein